MLTSKSVTLQTTGTEAVDRSFKNVAAVVNPVLQTPIVDGIMVPNLVIPSNGKLMVPTGFGRPVQGYHVAKASAAVPAPYEVSADQKSPNNSVVLTFASGAGATVSIWVY